MINSVFLLNQRGEVVIFRQYRDGVPRSKADAFRIKVIMRKEAANEPPVKIIDGITYFYTRCGNLFFVAASTFNVNACLVFQFLYQMIRIFKAYFGAKFDEGAIRNGFTLVYELLDEVLDHGYPQNCAVDVLKMYINFGAVKNKLADQAEGLTSQITGAIDWRRPGLSYKRNEVFIDVLESEFGRLTEGDYVGHIFSATTLAAFLPATDDVRLKRCIGFDVEQTYPFWRSQLVGGEGEEIDAEFLHVDRQFAGCLHGVCVEQHAVAAADRCKLLNRKQHAGLVIRPHDGNNAGVRADGCLQIADVNATVEVNRQERHLVTALLELVAKLDVG